MEHEAPIELCREHPEVVPAILMHLLKVKLPYFSRVRVTDPGTRTLVPTGQRSDAAVVLEDNGKPVVAAILEPQGRIDPGKWFAWPKYVADLHAEVRCDTYLIVLALTRSVAAWARQPIGSFLPGHGLVPRVIGPDDVPRVGSLKEACAEPWLAALAAMMHADDESGPEEALVAVQAARQTGGVDQAWWLYQLLRAIMTKERYQRLEEFIMLHPDVYLPKTDFEWSQFNKGETKGKAEGEIKGKAEAIVRLLGLRQIAVNDEDRARIHAEREMPTLDRWFDRALMARSVSELFT